jgi:predicted alpha/beta superfamily hydrolase
MKFLLRLSLLIVLGASAQNAASAQTPNDITIGKIDSLYSTRLKEERTVWVHVPKGSHKKDSSSRYPVVYLMDGNDHFTSVVGMIQRLSAASGNDLCPEMIVVGIPNTNRLRDLTPTHVISGPFGNSSMLAASGGGEEFTAFIEKELMPHIDSLYPTAPYRMFIGHSLGGLMVVNALIHHPALFNAYLAIDPSLWWDDQKLLKQAEGELSQTNRFAGKSLFLAVANTMAAGMDTMRVQGDTSSGSLHIRSILRFAADLRKNKGDGLRSDYKYYNEDSHGSVPLIAEYDGFRFLFDFYHFRYQARVFDPSTPADSAVWLVVAHFKNLSEQMGYVLLPPEEQVNAAAKGFVQNKLMNKAYAFYNLNVCNYPKSADAIAGLGDYYVAKGDKAKALESYNKALALGDNPDWVQQKIEKLKKGK